MEIPLVLNFNCTIQELKHNFSELKERILAKFQLHHTGIKTFGRMRRATAGSDYFNCTIQELKCIHYTTPKN